MEETESFPIDKVISNLIFERIPVALLYEIVKKNDRTIKFSIHCSLMGEKNLMCLLQLFNYPSLSTETSIFTELCDRCDSQIVGKSSLFYCMSHHNKLQYNLLPDTEFSEDHKGYHVDALGCMLIWVDGQLLLLDNGESPQTMSTYNNVAKRDAFELFRGITREYIAAFK